MSRLPLPDVFTENPDEKSIITYVVAFYHYFSKMKVLAVEGKRVGKVPSCVVGTPVLFVCPPAIGLEWEPPVHPKSFGIGPPAAVWCAGHLLPTSSRVPWKTLGLIPKNLSVCPEGLQPCISA